MLFEPLTTTSIQLANRTVMAPMTRSRADDANIPSALMAEYYAQRASAGLIIAEGTSPSPNGLGYARIPGLFNGAQVRGWKGVTAAVHAHGGKIFVQLMHTGRVSQPWRRPSTWRARRRRHQTVCRDGKAMSLSTASYAPPPRNSSQAPARPTVPPSRGRQGVALTSGNRS